MSENAIRTEGNEMESRIIETAKSLFMEKGYAETSMSDIAAKAGINRPTLHYYFRTKDKMFQAVFEMIIQKIVPQLLNLITARDTSIVERITGIVDAYYEVFRKNPTLPLFVVREIDRDVEHVVNTAINSSMGQNFNRLVESLRAEMTEGKLNTVPMPILFYTFYSALTFPFLTRKLSEHVLVDDNVAFDKLLNQWKPYIIRQMEALLCVRQQ